VLGHLADRRFGDPRRGHPVAVFGSAAAALERSTYADSRARGVLHLVLLAGTAAGGGLALERRARDHFVAHPLLTAVATWTVLGGTSLGREATAVHDLLAGHDLPGARQRLTHLVGRDTSQLSESEVVRAAVESLAENTSDAVVAPLVWGAVAGVPGLLGYRAANTLDAMVGHRSARHGRFGWAAARLDDVLNLPASRLTAALAVLLGEDRRSALRGWHRDAAAHPSPNAGPVEAAFAGALSLRLGGTNVYGAGADQRFEHRAVMGDGRPPVRADLARARQLARRVGVAAAAGLVALAWKAAL
jgi:adenosylcobinamide-phosphate synthase